jgi:hypothetical protein
MEGGVAGFFRAAGEGEFGVRLRVRERLSPPLQPMVEQRRKSKRERGDGQFVLIHLRGAQRCQPIRRGSVKAEGGDKVLNGCHRQRDLNHPGPMIGPGFPHQGGAPEGIVHPAYWQACEAVWTSPRAPVQRPPWISGC